jgi:CDP-diacylglycerol--glycerol-3-phosphate 3-phosphatidyltransferase/cardiolipin synthase
VTVANQITLVRIFLIPVFVGFAVYYSDSVVRGSPQDSLRYWAMAVFAIAALSDGIDGWVARRFNQRSKLGAILDPLADKLLLMTAICTLSFTAWPAKLPLWFVILYIAREVLSVAGAFVIKFVAGTVQIQPHWSGKTATVLEIAAVSVAMLNLTPLVLPVSIIAGVFIFSSGMVYLAVAVRQIKASGHGNAES